MAAAEWIFENEFGEGGVGADAGGVEELGGEHDFGEAGSEPVFVVEGYEGADGFEELLPGAAVEGDDAVGEQGAVGGGSGVDEMAVVEECEADGKVLCTEIGEGGGEGEGGVRVAD